MVERLIPEIARTGSQVKKVLLFSATTPFAVNAFLRTHLLALSQDFEVVLCVNTHAYPLVEEISKAIRVIHIDFARKISVRHDLKSLYQLVLVFSHLRPNAVHSITPKAGLLAMLASFLTNVPLRCHTFTGQIWATKTGFSRWLLKSMDRLIARLATHVFADSPSQCRLLEQESVVCPGGVKMLGKGSIAGVDLVRFKPDQTSHRLMREHLGVAEATTVFLFVGRLVRDKGAFDILLAFQKVLAHHPDWELWMVGPDEDGLLDELQAISRGAGDRIRWCGSSQCPEQYMAACDIFVLPSYREGFGSVIIEAAACGVPTIAYRIDGVVDAIDEGETGLLVKKSDITAFADAMAKLGESPSDRVKLGAHARERARRHFSSLTVTAEWKTFYGKLLQARATERDGHAG